MARSRTRKAEEAIETQADAAGDVAAANDSNDVFGEAIAAAQARQGQAEIPTAMTVEQAEALARRQQDAQACDADCSAAHQGERPSSRWQRPRAPGVVRRCRELERPGRREAGAAEAPRQRNDHRLRREDEPPRQPPELQDGRRVLRRRAERAGPQALKDGGSNGPQTTRRGGGRPATRRAYAAGQESDAEVACEPVLTGVMKHTKAFAAWRPPAPPG